MRQLLLLIFIGVEIVVAVYVAIAMQDATHPRHHAELTNRVDVSMIRERDTSALAKIFFGPIFIYYFFFFFCNFQTFDHLL